MHRTEIILAGLLCLSAIQVTADSLWKDNVSRPMFADKKAVSVGDIVTIVVQEDTSTSKDSNTKTSKETGIDASIASFLYPASASGMLSHNGKMPAMKIDTKNSFNGGGAIANSEKILGRVAVQVIDVMPNRNLVIEGSRDTAFSGEQQTMILRGVIRPEDISANNTIYSYNVANATIRFLNKGTVSDSQKKGWFTKAFDKLSPF